jgi:hypothetical protein
MIKDYRQYKISPMFCSVLLFINLSFQENYDKFLYNYCYLSFSFVAIGTDRIPRFWLLLNAIYINLLQVNTPFLPFFHSTLKIYSNI